MKTLGKAILGVFGVFVGLVVLIVVIGLAASGSSGETVSGEEHGQVVEGEGNFAACVRASGIISEYQESEYNADKKYKGKTVLVFGVCKGGVQMDFADNPFISLDTEGFTSLNASLVADDQALSVIRDGSKVWVVCKGRGEVIKSPMFGNCRVTKIE